MDDARPASNDTDRLGVPGTDPAGDPDRRSRRPGRDHVSRDFGRGLTTAAVVVAALAGAVAIGAVAALLTLFGWGVAVVVAILAVGVAAAIRPRPANGWLLFPVLALAIPAAAVAVSGVRVLPQHGRVVEAPASATDIPAEGYRAGLGDLLVDLRNLTADDGDRIVVDAGSDLGRTVVALPQSQCFNLDVRWQTGDLRLPRVRERPTVTGFRPKISLNTLGQQGPNQRKRYALTRGRMVLFGRAYDDDQGRWIAPASYAGAPTLTVELTSDGGSFVVRDYPDDVAPLRATNWPIDQVPPPRPAVVRRDVLRAEIDRVQRDLARAPRTRSTSTTATTASEPARQPPREPPVTQSASSTIPSKAPAGVVMIDRQGNLTEATAPEARWWRRMAKRRQAFAREWARRVDGACNQPGTFR